MAVISVTGGVRERGAVRPGSRSPLSKVLPQIANDGPSPFGSTYHKAFFACPREWALRYVAQLERETLSDPLTIGLLFHAALEVYYKTIQQYQQSYEQVWQERHPAEPQGFLRQDEYYWGAEPQAMRDAWAIIAPLADVPDYVDIWETLERVLDAYFTHYMGRDRYRIVAVEETLIYRSKDFKYSARLDTIVHDLRVDRIFILEHKTAARIGDDLLASYELDLQILGQVWLYFNCVDVDALPLFGGVRINLISKKKVPELVRHDVLPSDAHLDAFEDTLLQWRPMQALAEKMGYPKALGHCSGYSRGYSYCDYYEVCRSEPESSVKELSVGDPPIGFQRRAP